MNPVVMEWTQVLFRWLHVLAGIMWIGHLWFFNFVNAQLAKTYDADSKKKVVPELMPRALYWFRWGAAWTWLTGFCLAGLIYWMGDGMVKKGAGGAQGPGQGALVGIALVLLVTIFFIYDAVWKALASKEQVGVIVSFIGVAVLVAVLARIMDGRALFTHLGALFGTIMAMNVWMRIWPNQRKIIAAIKGGSAPDAALVSMAGLRSKHNTYMSVPLVFTMISNHFPGAYGHDLNWVILLCFVAAGWALTKWFFVKSASAAPAKFE